MKEELKKSAVVFDEAAHTYHLEGVALGGVTPIVKWVYPDTYKDIPENVLAKAAEHGSLIHKACQLYNEVGIADDSEPQVKDYIQIMCNEGLEPVASEYTVSDNENVASQIDVVYRGKGAGKYVLADIKTTSAIHVENVTLQLSIYAWLFELNNPGLVADRLCVVWLPKAMYGQAKMMDLERIPAEKCAAVVKSYVETMQSTEMDAEQKRAFGKTWASVLGGKAGEGVDETTPALIEATMPEKLAEVQKEIVRIETETKKMQEREKELKAGLLELMQKNNIKKWDGEFLTLTRKAASVRVSVDSTKLKKNYPEVYAEVQKSTNVSESLIVKVK